MSHPSTNAALPVSKVCIIGASGKLGQYMIQSCLDRGYEVVGVCLRTLVSVFGFVGRLTRMAELDDQVLACRRIFESDTRWTVVRGSDLEEGPSQGLPVWSRHVGDAALASNRTRRVDFALFMVQALVDDSLIGEAPAIVGCQTASARAHVQGLEANAPAGA